MSIELFNHAMDVVCSSQLVNLWREYHSALQSLTNVIHVDPDFSFVFLGSGFDGSPPLVSWQHLYNFNEKLDQENSFYLTRSTPAHAVLVEHRHSLALQEMGVNWKDRRPLIYYIDPGLTPTSVRLRLSGRTHTNMLRGSHGLPFTLASTAVLDDGKGEQRFYMSSEEFQSSYSNVFRDRRFLATFRPVLGKMDIDGGRGTADEHYDFKIHKLEGLGDGVYSVKTIPAIWCRDWPRAAFQWQSRQTKSRWPPQSLKNEIVKAGCHVLPSDPASRKNKYEWTLCFAEAESHILGTLGETVQKAFFLLKTMLHGMLPLPSHPKPDPIHAILLWSLEEKAPEEWKDVLASFEFLVAKALEHVSNRYIPHYFIPECNLLESIEKINISRAEKTLMTWLANPLEHLVQNQSLPFRFLQTCGLKLEDLSGESAESSDLDGVLEEVALLSSKVVSVVDMHLLLSFTEAVHFGVLTAFNHTHQRPVLNSMLLIRDQVRVLDSIGLPKRFTEPYKEFLESTLGVLYHARGLASRGKREREYLICKSGELLLANHNCDRTLGRLRLVQYYILRGQPKMALGILEPVMEWLGQGSTKHLPRVHPKEDGYDSESINPSEPSLDVSFKNRLWNQWLNKEYSFDMMIAKTTNQVRLPIMSSNTAFATVQILGITKSSVAVFSAACMAYLFQALSQMALEDRVAARCTLENLETIAEEEYEDEALQKRGIAYINLVANAYLQLRDKEKALQLYRYSVNLLGNPRNPARWKLVTLQHGRTWQAFKQGVKLIALTALASLVFSFLKSQLS